ncbi:unnamed protein product [Musa acuminata subsp. burmannicoides]
MRDAEFIRCHHRTPTLSPAHVQPSSALLPSTARHSLFLITLPSCRFRILNEVPSMPAPSSLQNCRQLQA